MSLNLKFNDFIHFNIEMLSDIINGDNQILRLTKIAPNKTMKVIHENNHYLLLNTPDKPADHPAEFRVHKSLIGTHDIHVYYCPRKQLKTR
jgi:hypothetical protein